MAGNVAEEMKAMAMRARKAAARLAVAGTDKKNAALNEMARLLVQRTDTVVEENSRDLEAARAAGLSHAMIDRLKLDKARIEKAAEGVRQVARLPDPVGEVLLETTRPNGMVLKKKRVPIGVIGIIYESRPNVTADCSALCLKAGNATVLRGGKEALQSNRAIGEALSDAVASVGLPEAAIQVVQTSDRAAVGAMLSLSGLIDLIIPRGGKGLIKRVVNESKIPVIKHYEGICHVFVHSAADLGMARNIVLNAKTQRTGVCNAAETLLVDSDIAEKFLPDIVHALREAGVSLLGCARSRQIVAEDGAWDGEADESSYRTEWLAMKMSVRVVGGLDEAIEHIEKYGSHHTDTIVTEDEAAAGEFLERVDSACVFHNVSTRFSDGFEFGLGAEIGISTDKIHARGPMGVEELTSYKWVAVGNGQLRQ